MKQLRRIAIAATVLIAALANASEAQTRPVTFVTNAYELRVQQFAAGVLANGSRYLSFGGDAKAVNGKVAADLRTFAFTVFFDVDASGAVTITDGTFLIQTINKDRSPLSIGGDILPGAALNLRAPGLLASGQKLSLSLAGSEGTDISGVITASVDKGTPPRLTGTLTLTYPVVQ
jgi:hypothetical protein